MKFKNFLTLGLIISGIIFVTFDILTWVIPPHKMFDIYMFGFYIGTVTLCMFVGMATGIHLYKQEERLRKQKL